MLLNVKICYVMKTLTEDYSGDVTTSFVQEKVKSGPGGGLFGGKLTERKVFGEVEKVFWCRELSPGERSPQNPFPQLENKN